MEFLKSTFLLTINMSVTATYVAIAIMGIRVLFLGKLPKKFSYALWGILWFRLISPISFSSAFSFLNMVKPNRGANIGVIEYIPQNIGMMQSPKVNVGIQQINNLVNATLPQATEHASMNPMQTIVFIGTILWAVGVVALTMYSVLMYSKIARRIRTATLFREPIVDEISAKVGSKGEVKVYVTDLIESPFVCGFIVPRIYMPANTSKKELPYILAHEFAHVKRYDYLIKPLSYFVMILHWFNPILWLSFRLMSSDMEMSCDEKVMETLGSEIKHDYSNSLLSLAIKENRLFQASPLAFGESNIKSRIKNILKFKKPSIFIALTILIVVGFLGFTLLANPLEKTEQDNRGLDYKKIYGHKTAYVGDASKVGNLTNALYYSEYKGGISLKTDAKPYRVTVHYHVEPGTLMKSSNMKLTDKMMKNAAIMFSLIDNVDEIHFNMDVGKDNYDFPFDRTFFNEYFGQDIRRYADSFDQFNNEWIPKLDRENWERANFEVYLTNQMELYVWKNRNTGAEEEIYYTLLPGTNRPKDKKDIYDVNMADKDIENVNQKLAHYQDVAHLSIRHEFGISKQDMMKISEEIIFHGQSKSIGAFEGTYEEGKFSPLLPFTYETGNKIETMAYAAALEHYGKSRGGDYLTVVAPKVFGTHEKGDELSIFVTVYYRSFQLYGNTLHSQGGGVVPAAIRYTKNSDGSYTFKEYTEAMDGAYFQKSIEEFCGPRKDIAKAIMKHYSNYGDLSKLIMKNLGDYLKKHGLEGIRLKEFDGSVIPLS